MCCKGYVNVAVALQERRSLVFIYRIKFKLFGLLAYPGHEVLLSYHDGTVRQFLPGLEIDRMEREYDLISLGLACATGSLTVLCKDKEGAVIKINDWSTGDAYFGLYVVPQERQ